MSAPNPGGQTFLGEIIPEYVALASWPAIQKGIGKAFTFLTSTLSDEGKKEVSKMVFNGIKKTFKEIRNELYGFIEYYVRAASPEAADGLIAHLHRRKKPLQEYRTWSVLMGLYESLAELKEETERLEVFIQLGLKSDDEFDMRVDDLTHDPVKQFFDWVKSLPLWKQARIFLQLADDKLRLAALLFVGLPVWILVLMMGLGVYNLTDSFFSPHMLIFYATVGLILAWGVGTLRERRRTREKEAKAAEQKAGAPEADPREVRTAGIPWLSIFGWGSLGFVPLIFVSALVQSDRVYLPFVLPWMVAIIFGIGIGWLILGNHPLAAVAAHFAGRIPRYGLPIRTILYGFGSVILFNIGFAVLSPFAHFEEHPVLALLSIIAIITYLIAAFTYHPGWQTAAIAALVGMAIYGCAYYGIRHREDWLKFRNNWTAAAKQWQTPKPAKAAAVKSVTELETRTVVLKPVPQPAETPRTEAKFSEKKPVSRPASKERTENTDFLYEDTPAARSSAPAPAVQPYEYASVPQGTTHDGMVIPCYDGTMPHNNKNYFCMVARGERPRMVYYSVMMDHIRYESGTLTIPDLEYGDWVRVELAGRKFLSGQVLRKVNP